VAYVGENNSAGLLITAQPSGAVQVHHLGVAESTSPAIAAVASGYQIAFQGNDGRL
jgi:hypothetical protein